MDRIEEILAQIGILGQIPTEIRDFMAWLKDRDIKSVLEIGVMEGGTLACWKGLFPNAYVLGVDIGTGGTPQELRLQRAFGFEVMMRSDSHDPQILERIKRRYGNTFDFIFIDGDHSYKGVKRDYEMYFPLVSKEGIIAFHDIKDTGHHRDNGVFVGRWWNEIKGSYSHSIKEFADPSVDWGGIGVLLK